MMIVWNWGFAVLERERPVKGFGLEKSFSRCSYKPLVISFFNRKNPTTKNKERILDR